jgi:hypothetical protein
MIGAVGLLGCQASTRPRRTGITVTVHHPRVPGQGWSASLHRVHRPVPARASLRAEVFALQYYI